MFGTQTKEKDIEINVLEIKTDIIQRNPAMRHYEV
jgi:hypothetical protein